MGNGRAQGLLQQDPRVCAQGSDVPDCVTWACYREETPCARGFLNNALRDNGWRI